MSPHPPMPQEPDLPIPAPTPDAPPGKPIPDEAPLPGEPGHPTVRSDQEGLRR